jgi:hypothetical protein
LSPSFPHGASGAATSAPKERCNYHYDPYAQAISKIERGHAQDMKDVTTMFERGLITSDELLRLFAAIEPELYRFPAIDPQTLRRKIEAAARDHRTPRNGP